jgi:hypothetical protein
VPEAPADATVVEVATEIPVEAPFVLPDAGVVPAIAKVPAGVPPVVAGMLCECPGSVTVDVEVAVCVWLTAIASFEPPVLLALYVVPAPTGKRSLKSGRLKVVLPSPTPNVVLVTANKVAYVERLTACPLHSKYPLGAVPVGHSNKLPLVTLTGIAAIAVATKAVVARAVVLFPADCVVANVPVGRTGVPVKVGDKLLAFVAIAVTRLLNSVSISVPLTIFRALPVERLSLDAKFVLFV